MSDLLQILNSGGRTSRQAAIEIKRLRTDRAELLAALELERANYTWLLGVMRNAIAAQDFTEARAAITKAENK